MPKVDQIDQVLKSIADLQNELKFALQYQQDQMAQLAQHKQVSELISQLNHEISLRQEEIPIISQQRQLLDQQLKHQRKELNEKVRESKTSEDQQAIYEQIAKLDAEYKTKSEEFKTKEKTERKYVNDLEKINGIFDKQVAKNYPQLLDKYMAIRLKIRTQPQEDETILTIQSELEACNTHILELQKKIGTQYERYQRLLSQKSDDDSPTDIPNQDDARHERQFGTQRPQTPQEPPRTGRGRQS